MEEELYKQINLLQQENNVLRQSISKLEEYYKSINQDIFYIIRDRILDNKKNKYWEFFQEELPPYIEFGCLVEIFENIKKELIEKGLVKENNGKC